MQKSGKLEDRDNTVQVPEFIVLTQESIENRFIRLQIGFYLFSFLN